MSETYILVDQLPEVFKNRFGEIGFVKWGKAGKKSSEDKRYLPVLIVNPFDVPLDVRQQWIDKFHLSKCKGKLANMVNVVFWYGSTSLENAFSFVVTKNIINFEKGSSRDRNYHVLPARIENLLRNGLALDYLDALQQQGIVEMEDDMCSKDHDQRRPSIFDEGPYNVKRKMRRGRMVD
jgi:hypothetical protein